MTKRYTEQAVTSSNTAAFKLNIASFIDYLLVTIGECLLICIQTAAGN
jgi:hypothetical protein